MAKSPRKKVGLALGSGAARGLAHIGVLEVLQREGIPIDMIAGTSAGAAIGAIYAQGKDFSLVKDLALSRDWKKWLSLVDLVPHKTGFIGGKKITGLLKTIIGDVKFGELDLPLACVATDVNTGEEIVITRGSVLRAVRASISIPVIFTADKWLGRYLVDGILVNPVPVSVLKEMGADFVIAVNVIPDTRTVTRQPAEEETEEGKEPNIFSIMILSIYSGIYSLVRTCLEDADIVIQPQVSHIGAGEFHRAEEFILQGELAARDAIPEIKRRLGA